MVELRPPTPHMAWREHYRWLYDLWRALVKANIVNQRDEEEINNIKAVMPVLAEEQFGRTSSIVLVGDVPAGATILRAIIEVQTPYDDPNARISMGTDSDHGLIVQQKDVNLNRTGRYEFDVRVLANSDMPVRVYLTSSGNSGKGVASIFYATGV